MSRSQALRRIKVGDKMVFSKTITQEDIELFARITGDVNPIHLSDDFARKTIFNGAIAHGILTAGLISAALSKLPGVIIYLSQDLRFVRPVRPGEIIEAVVEVVEKLVDRSELKLKTTCMNQRRELVLDGEAQVRVLEIKGE